MRQQVITYELEQLNKIVKIEYGMTTNENAVLP